MGNYTIGPKIGLDGEADFRKQLNGINECLRTTDSEMKKVTSAFSDNAKSEEALRAKNDVLNKSIELQEKKLSEVRKALEYSKSEYGDNATQTQKWQRILNNTETDLNNLRSEVKKNEQAIDSLGDELKDSDKALDNFGDSADKASDKLSKIKDMAAIGATVAAGAVVAGKAVVDAGEKIYDLAKEVAESGDEVDKLSQRMGLSNKAFQQWSFVLSQSGVDITSTQTGFKTLTNTIDDAKNNSEKAIEKFERLGITVDDLKDKSREDIFAMTVTGLQNITDETEKAALANDLFGKSGQNIMPLLNQSSEATQELIKQTEEYNMIMSDEAVKASAAFIDSQDKLQRTFEGTKNKVASEFMPGITMVMDGLSDLINGQEDAGEAIKEGIEDVFETVEEILPQFEPVLLSVFESVLEILPELLKIGIDIVVSLVEGLLSGDSITELFNAAIEIIMSLANALIESIPKIIPAICNIIDEIVNVLTDPEMLVGLILVAVEIIIALANGIVENIDKLLNSCEKIIENLATGIVLLIPELIPIALKIISALANALIRYIPELLSVIPRIISALFNGLGNVTDDAKQWGKDFIQNIVDGINEMIQNVKNAVISVADTISSFLHFSVPDEGPLRDSPNWMPDMIDLMTQGIEDNEHKLKKAARSLATLLDEEFYYNANISNVGYASSNITVHAPTYLDGVLIADNTQKVVTNQQSSVSKGRGAA